MQNSEAGMFYNDSVEKFLYCAIVLPIVYGFSVCNIQKKNLAAIGKACTTYISKAIILLMTKLKKTLKYSTNSE